MSRPRYLVITKANRDAKKEKHYLIETREELDEFLALPEEKPKMMVFVYTLQVYSRYWGE